MSFVRYKKIGNKEYAIEVTLPYDKVKTGSVQKNKYLRHVMKREWKEFIRPGNVNMKHEKRILDFGDSYFLIKFMEKKNE